MTVRDLLGDLVATIHAGFVVFVVGGFVLIMAGELLHWRWVQNNRFRYIHLAATVFTLIRVWMGAACPMWFLEDWVRGSVNTVDDPMALWCHRLCFRSDAHRVFQIKTTVFAAFVIAQMLVTLVLKHRDAGRLPERCGQ
jgi:hypothetical protein